MSIIKNHIRNPHFVFIFYSYRVPFEYKMHFINIIVPMNILLIVTSKNLFTRMRKKTHAHIDKLLCYDIIYIHQRDNCALLTEFRSCGNEKKVF